MNEDGRPSISVVVPVYNTGKYLAQCIESIISSSFENMEIVLIDDGSTDESANVCDSYAEKDHRIRVIHKDNQGLVHARITGVMAARAEYITFVDSDDWIDSTMIEKLYDSIEEGIDIVVSGIRRNKEGKDVLTFMPGDRKVMVKGEGILELFKEQKYDWSGCAKLYKKNVLSWMDNWWTDSSYGEDTELNWRAFLLTEKVCYIPVYGYHYRMNVDSMMHQTISVERFGYVERYERIMRQVINMNEEIIHVITQVVVKTIMPIFVKALLRDEFSEDMLARMQNLLREVIKRTSEDLPDDLEEGRQYVYVPIEKAKRLRKEKERLIVEEFQVLQHSEFYIWGTGEYAVRVLRYLDELRIKPLGFVVTKKKRECFCGYDVCSYQELTGRSKGIRYLLALNEENTGQVLENMTQEEKEKCITLFGKRVYF